jgi:hypothetical protein
MATSIFFGGRVISVPGSYSQVDASGLEGVGLGASGIVAVLGTAEGGVPASALTEFGSIPRFSTAEKMKAAYRSGQLLEVADMLFAPAKDADIPAGPQAVLALKTNPATQSTAQLKLSTLPQVDLTSRDYGVFTGQVNVALSAGTTKGRHLTIAFEDKTETVDDLGGDAVFQLQYVPGSYGYQTMLASINAAGDVSCVGTRYQTVIAADAPAAPAGNNAVELTGTDITGTIVSISAPAAGGIQTLVVASGMIPAMVGRTVTIGGAGLAANRGTFTILTQALGTTLTYVNATGVVESGTATYTISDAGIRATVYGLVAGVPTKEVLVHAGTATVTSTHTWDALGVLAVILDKAPVAGAAVVKNAPGGTTIYSLPVGTLSKGAIVCENAFVEKSALSLKLSTAGTPVVLVFGRDQAGSDLAESVTMTGATPVLTLATTWSQVTAVVVSNVASTVVVTLTATAAATLGTVQTKLNKVQTYFDSKQNVVGTTVTGFLFTYGTGKTSFLMADMDIVLNTSVEYPATGSFLADLYGLIAWINANSQLISAAESAGATAMPDNTAAPIYLSGGVEGTALFTHAQAALNLLKKGRVNSIVDLSGDPAVAAALDSHCAFMGGIGRSERDGFVGLLNGAMTGVPSKTEIKNQIVNLNSRHIRAWGQAISRYNAAGDQAEFLPPYGAAILAGMQAGSPVGTSLTYKYMNILGLRQSTTWNPTDDAEELIQAGLVFALNVDGVGRRVVRNVTTHLSSNNIAYCEGSVNNAVNFAVFNFRQALEFAVGKRGYAGTLAATRGVSVGILGLLVDNTVITSYRSLLIELIVDVMDVSVEISPIIPINFVRTTVHLVTIAQTA